MSAVSISIHFCGVNTGCFLRRAADFYTDFCGKNKTANSARNRDAFLTLTEAVFVPQP